MKRFSTTLENFCQARNLENMAYDDMVEYADSYLYHDIDAYVALYKSANTPWQRKHALEHIYSIIDDDTFMYHDELIQNLKKIVFLGEEFLDEKDETKFDAICGKILNFYRNQFQSSVWCIGQVGSIPDVPIETSSKELQEVAEIIISTDMRNLESYQMALAILGA